jgi:hypothetical protein
VVLTSLQHRLPIPRITKCAIVTTSRTVPGSERVAAKAFAAAGSTAIAVVVMGAVTVTVDVAD